MSQKHILFLNYCYGYPDTLDRAFVKDGFGFDVLNAAELNHERLPNKAPDAIIVMVNPASLAFEEDISDVRGFYKQHDLPVLALLESSMPIEVDAFDSVLLNPVYPSQVIARIHSLMRLRAMQKEISLRLETLEDDFKISIDLPNSERQSRLNILFIGKASPDFMVIINALQTRNVNVVAAFTSFTAFEYLYEQDFDAVVLNGMGTLEPAQTIIETMRKNAKLYHVPTLMIIENETFKDHDRVFKAGLNDVLDVSSDMGEISARVIEQANFHRLHEGLKTFFDKLGNQHCLDTDTKLYNRRFFDAHIARLSQSAREQQLPLSLALVRLQAENPAGASKLAMNELYRQAGLIFKNLIRMQDFAARLSDNVYAVAFPGQAPDELTTVRDRIAGVLETANLVNFESGEPVKFDFEITLTNLVEPAVIEDVA